MPANKKRVQRVITEQRDFVFVAARGSLKGGPCAYIDLYRVEDQKIAEHGDFPNIPPRAERKNDNGMLQFRPAKVEVFEDRAAPTIRRRLIQQG